MVSQDGHEGAKTPQYLVTVAATLMVFSGGAAIGWSSPALHMYDDNDSTLPMHPTTSQGSWISSLLTIGCLIGALPAGSVADMIGRKVTLLILVIPFLISWGIIFFAEKIAFLYGARLLGGIGLGAVCTVVPMYISEIAEDSVRGVLGSFFQLMICAGILYTYTVGAIASYYVMAVACAILPVAFFLAFFKAPESPPYLLRKGRRTQAKESLQTLRGKQHNVSKELQILENELNSDGDNRPSFCECLSRKETKMGIIISLGMMACQQLSGVNIVIFYSSKIFDSAGSKLDSQVCTILVGLAQLVACLISMVLIEKLGRKLLLQISAVCMALALVILGFYFYWKDRGDDVASLGVVPIAAVIGYILLFGVGFGPIPWMLASEVLTDDVKGVVTGIAVSLNWTLAFIVTFTFQSIVDQIGNACTYWLLAFICLLAFLFVTFVVIETKGKSIPEIQDILAGRKPKKIDPDV